MHPIMTAKSWSHHLHDGALAAWHQIDQHLRSRHFWTGVGIALLAIGLVALVITLVRNAPLQGDYLYGSPYGFYR